MLKIKKWKGAFTPERSRDRVSRRRILDTPGFLMVGLFDCNDNPAYADEHKSSLLWVWMFPFFHLRIRPFLHS
jgi:hypothetical protein